MKFLQNIVQYLFFLNFMAMRQLPFVQTVPVWGALFSHVILIFLHGLLSQESRVGPTFM